MTSKTYSLIENSIKNWDSAAGDKVKALFHKFDEVLITSRSFNYSDVKFEEAIDKIIKFRNTTTHGNYMRIEGEHADTAINFMTLIYISRLSRFGMEEEKIRDLINRGIVYG